MMSLLLLLLLLAAIHSPITTSLLLPGPSPKDWADAASVLGVNTHNAMPMPEHELDLLQQITDLYLALQEAPVSLHQHRPCARGGELRLRLFVLRDHGAKNAVQRRSRQCSHHR